MFANGYIEKKHLKFKKTNKNFSRTENYFTKADYYYEEIKRTFIRNMVKKNYIQMD